MDPSNFIFLLNIHLQPIGFEFGGKLTSFQVWFKNIYSNSLLIAFLKMGIRRVDNLTASERIVIN